MNYQEMSNEQIEFAVSDALNIPRGDKWCSDWADAGPIIQEHRIPLNLFRDEWTAGERRNVKDKNPLRAAMIVFLMMKGGE